MTELWTAIGLSTSMTLGLMVFLFAKLSNRLDGHDARFDTLLARMDSRFDAMDAKWERKFDGVTERLDRLFERVVDHDHA